MSFAKKLEKPVFTERGLPSVALDKGFPECSLAFAKWQLFFTYFDVLKCIFGLESLIFSRHVNKSEFYFLPSSYAFVILITPSNDKSSRLPILQTFKPPFSDAFSLGKV